MHALQKEGVDLRILNMRLFLRRFCLRLLKENYLNKQQHK